METVWIVLIVAIALIIIVFMLRDRITFLGGSVSRNQNGVETRADAKLGADPSRQLGTGTRISGNKMVGNRQRISSEERGAQIEKNYMKGEDLDIRVDAPGGSSSSSSSPSQAPNANDPDQTPN